MSLDKKEMQCLLLWEVGPHGAGVPPLYPLFKQTPLLKTKLLIRSLSREALNLEMTGTSFRLSSLVCSLQDAQ